MDEVYDNDSEAQDRGLATQVLSLKYRAEPRRVDVENDMYSERHSSSAQTTAENRQHSPLTNEAERKKNKPDQEVDQCNVSPQHNAAIDGKESDKPDSAVGPESGGLSDPKRRLDESHTSDAGRAETDRESKKNHSSNGNARNTPMKRKRVRIEARARRPPGSLVVKPDLCPPFARLSAVCKYGSFFIYRKTASSVKRRRSRRTQAKQVHLALFLHPLVVSKHALTCHCATSAAGRGSAQSD